MSRSRRTNDIGVVNRSARDGRRVARRPQNGPRRLQYAVQGPAQRRAVLVPDRSEQRPEALPLGELRQQRRTASTPSEHPGRGGGAGSAPVEDETLAPPYEPGLGDAEARGISGSYVSRVSGHVIPVVIPPGVTPTNGTNTVSESTITTSSLGTCDPRRPIRVEYFVFSAPAGWLH